VLPLSPVQGRREHDDNPKAEATPSGSNAIHLHAIGKISSEILDHIVGDQDLACNRVLRIVKPER
jgi:hypothetical protein